MSRITTEPNYSARVKALRRLFKLSQVSLITLAHDLSFSLDDFSDILYLRKRVDEGMLSKIERYARCIFPPVKEVPEMEHRHVGERVNYLRRQLKLSEQELGAGLTPCRSGFYIRAIEQGQLLPSPQVLTQLSELSGVSIEWLNGG